jgi:hypothetical protein
MSGMNTTRIFSTALIIITSTFSISMTSNLEAQQSKSSCYHILRSGELRLTNRNEVCQKNMEENQRFNKVFLPSKEIKTILDKASKAISDGNEELALSLWSQALKKSKNNPEALLRRGSLYLVREKYRQGYQDFQYLERLLRNEGFQERANIIAKMIKDTQAEYLKDGININ